jgi:hypothetical protein
MSVKTVNSSRAWYTIITDFFFHVSPRVSSAVARSAFAAGKEKSAVRVSKDRKKTAIRAPSAALVAKFKIPPGRWQHLRHVAIVPSEIYGKTDKNDWDTACGNFKT